MKIKNSDNPAYSKDNRGQWWWTAKRGDRMRARVLECARCSSKFLTYAAKRITPKYCSNTCSFYGSGKVKTFAKFSKNQYGEKNPAWKGGKTIDVSGYVRVLVPEHHSTTKTKPRVLEHRLVMEKKLGRNLEPWENVHHKNGIKTDNRPENLELWAVHQPKGQRAEEHQHCPTCTCFKHKV